MANKMKIKRDLLVSFLQGVLQAHDSTYTVEDRLRLSNINQTSRNDRIQIMGENYAYAEVLYRPAMTPEGQRSAKSTTRRAPHDYDIYIWYKYEDADQYANSSQAIWDDITEADDGVKLSIENKPYLTDASNNQYTIGKPENLVNHEVFVDTNPMELAHFMNFQVTIKG